MSLDSVDRRLRFFVSIADLGSLSKAATVLDQTQSGLSKQLALLEAHVDQRLFVRTGRGLKLTEAGEILYESVKPAFLEIDRAMDQVRKQGITQGTVRLAAVHTLSYYFTADCVATFVSNRPHVNLSLMGRSSPEVVTLVEHGNAELGLVYDSAVNSDVLVSTALFEEDMALIVRQDSALSGPQDLTCTTLQLVGFPPHYALRKMIHSGGLEPHFVTEAETVDAMLKLVSSGVGDCILPSRIPTKVLADYGLKKVKIELPLLRRRMVLIKHHDKPLSALAIALEQCILQLSKAMNEQVE
ncbi:LysR family transcriptional regulator [Advenella sp. S44]|uniref:LysR family transcriptional regulator n=2 Tax=Advenella TaxID=290425 RepID=A0A356LAS0_9BURK|nr:LysR family transcriptional regulator [Advenella sp. S44]PJX20277.1 LysR family transcriptional regulator [Advenella sp. S44]HBP28087.1 LysR family transcriptional regulator [Advenella kashmirensis]